ncbi:glycosyltransferase family 2 protein [Algoriphagus kandeliae]|uniref:Glycosyltransferase family 2 protein n=1 Tax=Algoriphagus kandeliae TaxID=2562278 RepID=A0A4Y9QXS0_9BACT|nr:glycosyltransferase family A protein [Algoriphagus kandeliae]TFV97264.1 glycosyltransferase family 2 protein [Algoriphagus kandeliae]
MSPKISVIIPFFNSEKNLERAVNSVISQSFTDWELILVDDGSSDNSGKIAKSFLEDFRISYFFQENSGVSVARNLGASKANGYWLIFLDSDDELDSSLFFELIQSTSENIHVVLWGFNWVFQNGKSKTFIRKGEKYIPNLSGSFAFKRVVFLTLGGFDESLNFGENTELFHRISLSNLIIKELAIIGFTYHDSNNGGSKNLQNSIDSNLIILEKHKETLSNHTKHLYHQVIGVNQLRFRRYKEARKNLWIAYTYKPFKLSTLVRFFISLFPFLVIRLYSEKVG